MSIIYTKITWHMEIQENITQSQEKSQSTDATPKINQVLEWSDRDIKAKIKTICVRFL